MSNKQIHIKFNKQATQVREPLLNSYGFDLTNENAIGYTTGKLKFTVLGFRPTHQLDTLISTIKVSLNPHVKDDYTHVQKLNFYEGERINTYCRTASFQLNVNVDEVKAGIYSLRERLEKYRLDELNNTQQKTQTNTFSKEENKQANEVLKVDNLMDCIEGLLKQAGLITETENGVRLFLILLSRNFDSPLHALLQGSTQLSKMLMEVVYSTLPENQVRELTSMSTSAMYYNRVKDYWKNKVVYIKSIEKHFRGVSTLKEFIENTILKRHITESEHISRQLYSADRIIPSSICLMAYSEDDNINNKFFQECFLLRVEENEQNKADMLNHLQKEYAGKINLTEQENAKRVLQAIQSKIQPMNVIIPFADKIQLPNSVQNPIQSFNQLITFIKSITLLHQFQLNKKRDKQGNEYIEANEDHLQIALELFKSIILTKSDILSPKQRTFLERLKISVKDKEECFMLTEVIKQFKISKSAFYRQITDLKDLGYLEECGGNKKEGIKYKLTQTDEYKNIQEESIAFEKQKLKTDK